MALKFREATNLSSGSAATMRAMRFAAARRADNHFPVAASSAPRQPLASGERSLLRRLKRRRRT